jgi:hypothetical protein
MFKPVLYKDDDTNTHRVEFHLIPEMVPQAPAPIDLPNWLVEEIFHVWRLEYRITQAPDKVRAIKVIRAVTGLGLKPAKDAMDALWEVHTRCMSLAG